MIDPFTPKKLEFKTSEVKKIKGIECCAYSCKSKPNKKKAGLCHKHYAIHRRIKDPIYDRYVNFKNNALRRGKYFTITLQEFIDFCNKTGYIIKKGMRGRNCTVDRIRNNEGYHINNIQLLTLRQNIDKYNFEDKLHEDYTPF